MKQLQKVVVKKGTKGRLQITSAPAVKPYRRGWTVTGGVLGGANPGVGHKFWARGYFVTTVGRDEEVIRAYIRNQELADRQLAQFELKISAAQNLNNRPNIP